MRTTIELASNHRQILHQLSQMRGYRGYSKIIREAIDFFVENKHLGKNEQTRLLQLKGSWKNSEALKTRQALDEVRANWKK